MKSGALLMRAGQVRFFVIYKKPEGGARYRALPLVDLDLPIMKAMQEDEPMGVKIAPGIYALAVVKGPLEKPTAWQRFLLRLAGVQA